MTAAWIQDIFERSPGAYICAHDKKLLLSFYEKVGRKDIEFLKELDLLDSAPYERLTFLKQLIMRWNRKKSRFANADLQGRLDQLMLKLEDLDLELLKHGAPLPGHMDRLTLAPPHEKYTVNFPISP